MKVSFRPLTQIGLVAGCLVFMPIQAAEDGADFQAPAAGSVNETEGLEAWDRIFQVASHPRCSNCHVGESDVPMWSGPAYEKAYGLPAGGARKHGMNVKAGESRIGVETIACSTCHTTSDIPNETPHAAPRVNMSWSLAPVEAAWFGKSSQTICEQLRDPERNGGRTFEEIASHLNHDLILHWAWEPSGGREPAPFSLKEHINDVLIWGAAGMPCASGSENN